MVMNDLYTFSRNIRMGNVVNVGTDKQLTGVLPDTYTKNLKDDPRNSSVLKAYLNGIIMNVSEFGNVHAGTFVNQNIDSSVSFINGVYLTKGNTLLLMGQHNPVDNGLYFINRDGYARRYEGLTRYSGQVFTVDKVKFVCISSYKDDFVGKSALYFDAF